MLTKDIEENFPFLSVVTYGGNEYIGIIINQDTTVTSMYVYTDIKNQKEQTEFFKRLLRYLSRDLLCFPFMLVVVGTVYRSWELFLKIFSVVRTGRPKDEEAFFQVESATFAFPDDRVHTKQVLLQRCVFEKPGINIQLRPQSDEPLEGTQINKVSM